MHEDQNRYKEKARDFDSVLGLELYFVEKKRRAPSAAPATEAQPADDTGGYALSDYLEFERLNEKRSRLSYRDRRLSVDETEKKIHALEKDALNTKSTKEAKILAASIAVLRQQNEDLVAIKQLEARLQDNKGKVADRAWNANLIGLSLSGGGIRSATFNLGILQSLANLQWLRRIDYLSTVSGGGYIGGWLTAMINREHAHTTGDNATETAGIVRAEKRIRTECRPGGNCDVEDSAITFLRRYSNYLTPKKGLLSADTWSAVATYVRNVLLNLTILIAGIALVLLVPRLLAVIPGLMGDSATLWLIGLSLVISLLPSVVLGYNLASLLAVGSTGKKTPPSHGQTQLLILFVLPFFLIALLCSFWLPNLDAAGISYAPLLTLNQRFFEVWSGLPWMLWAGLMYMGLWGTAYGVASGRQAWLKKRHKSDTKQDHLVWIRLLLSGFFAGATAGLLIWLVAKALQVPLNTLQQESSVLVQVTVGPPLLLCWVYLLAVIHTGFMGFRLKDGQREWLSRLGAWMMIISIGWLSMFGIALFGPLVLDFFGKYAKLAATSGWLVTTVAGLVLGRTSSGGQNQPSFARGLLIAAAPYVFIVGFVIAISAGLNASLRETSEKSPDGYYTAWHVSAYEEALAENVPTSEVVRKYLDAYGSVQRQPLYLFGWFAILALVVLLQGRFIRINEFSLHRFYGNRLARCYLGASTPDREAGKQSFTGFNRDDDLLLNGLEFSSTTSGSAAHLHVDQPGPIPIINTAINLVAGDELAWQQRKAASFSLTPLFCGFEPSIASGTEPDDGMISCHGYRPTARFAGKDELSLGTAMTVSGAAASPNMGHHTTPALAFLFTVFNVRLGRWVGNPRHNRGWTRSGPLFAPWHLAREIFGLTSSRTKYVYLSDGGHFENLGIYELVKRRCRFIIACDAGADPELKFEDIGNAIRKCRTDLGVDINLDLSQIQDRKNGFSKWHCALGDVVYERDDSKPKRGKILYIKASLTGAEPADVLNYANTDASFPHQTTADQFFDEAQFESYRRLGEHVCQEVLARCSEEATVDGRLNVENAFVRLGHQWHTPLKGSAHFTLHSKTLSDIFERLRRTESLAFLDTQIYPEWCFLNKDHECESDPQVTRNAGNMTLPKSAASLRQGFYFCNALIQLMEDVYLDLGLERDWNHPDTRGWMNLFKHWSWVAMFRVTWAISAATYGRRFQLFCERHLGLSVGEVAIRGPFSINDTEASRAIVRTLCEKQSAPITADFRPAIDALFDNGEHVALNYVELGQVLRYLQLMESGEGGASQHYRICLLQSNVEVPGVQIDEESNSKPAYRLFHFVFGYALLREPGKIEVFRVQDHLRQLGLARAALGELLKAYPDLDIEVRSHELCKLGDDFTERSIQSFADLFRSAKREHEAASQA